MPELDCRTEWNHLDLVLFQPKGATLIELKFFAANSLCDYTGKKLRMKGGPSKKNFDEYECAIEKLRTVRNAKWIMQCGDIASAHLLLAYVDSQDSAKTFGRMYDGIASDRTIRSVRTIRDRVLVRPELNFTCKLITVNVAT